MNQLRVSIHTALSRLGISSGVPRHIKEVVSGLLRDQTLSVEFFVNRLEAAKWLPAQSPMWQNVPVTAFDSSTSVMVRRWGLLNRPSFESLGGEADWLYLPADGYVPTRDAKLAVTVHDVYKLEPPAPFEDKFAHYYARLRHSIIYSRVAKHAERILAVSEFSANRIMHYLNVPAERIEIVYNGVSDAFFRPNIEVWERLRARLNLEEGKFLVYSGGLKAKKNATGIIAVWSEIENRYPDYRLVVLGHHDPRFLQHAKQSLKTAIFPEYMNDDEIAAFLQHSAALFFPSFYEGFGIPVVEAMAAGTLLVLSDIPALRELGKGLAFYANPDDIGDIKRAVEACLAASDERAARIAAGRTLAETYTWSACVNRVRATLN